MSDNPEPWESVLSRLLDEGRDVSWRLLTHRQEAGTTNDAGLAGRIAHIRACLASIGEDASTPSPPSAASRLRLLVALSTLPGGERRLHPRWPLVKVGMLRLAAREERVTLLDLGNGGAMIAPVEGLSGGQSLDAALVLGGDPEIAAVITTDADRVGHLAFAPGILSSATTLAGELQDWAAHYEAELWQATALANEVERLFETGLSDGEIEPDDLFSPHPLRRRGRPAALASRLEAVLAQALPPLDELAYVAATDRHAVIVGDPGRRLCRSDAMDGRGRSAGAGADAVGLRAALFAEKALVQTYRRRPGQEPRDVVTDIAAPVVIRGRRWGCVRIGRSPPAVARV